MQRNRAGYGFQRKLAPTQKRRKLACDIQTNMMNKAWKNDYLKVTKFVYWRSTYILSVLVMRSKHDLRQLKNFVYLTSNYCLSVLNIRGLLEKYPTVFFYANT
jgi:hypothetical protein